MEEHHYFIVVPNDDEDPYEGYFAYVDYQYNDMMAVGGYGALGETKGPYPTRGYGDTQLEAVANLVTLLAFEAGDKWPETEGVW